MFKLLLIVSLAMVNVFAAAAQCAGVVRVLLPETIIGDSLTLHSTQTHMQQRFGGESSFTFYAICPGESVIALWHGGAIVSRQNIAIHANDTITVALPLPNYTLQPIDIRTGLPILKRNAVYVRENIALLAQPLAIQLERLPGMSSLQTGSRIAKPAYFGFSGQRLILFKNNLRLEGQQWGMDHGPEINPLYASRMELVHGADAIALAGDGVGGVIRLLPPDAIDSLIWAIHVRQSYRTNGHQFLNAIDIQHQPQRIKGLALRLSGSDSRAGNLGTPTGLLANTAFKEFAWDGGMRFERGRWMLHLEHGIYGTTIGIFTGSHSGNLTDLQNRIHNNVLPLTSFTRRIGRPNQTIYHEASQVNATYRVSPRSFIQWIAGRQYDERKEYDAHIPLNDSLAALNKPALHLHLTDYQGQLSWNTQWTDVLKTVLSIGVHHQINTFNGRFYVPNYTRHYRHGAWQMHWRKNKHAIALCTRIDHLNQVVYRNANGSVVQLQKQYLQPSIGLSWTHDPTKNQRIQLHLTSSNRPPTINEMYSNGLHHGLAVYELGNENLQQEFAHRLLSEYQITHGSLRFSATGMLQYIQGYIYSAPQNTPILTIRGAFPVTKVNQSNARLAGLHTQLDYLLRNSASISVSHQSVRTVLTDDGSTPAFTPSDQYRMIIRYPIFTTSSIHVFMEWNTLYTTKQWRVSQATDILPPPQAALVHGVRIHGERRHRQSTIEFGCGAENLFNTSYRLYTDRMRYYHDALSRNIQFYLHIPLNFYKK